jgi:glycosyltransferase involved in cell wall biosynthesis
MRLRVGVVTETYAPDVNGCAMAMGRLVHGMLERGHQVQLVRVRHGRTDRYRFDGECEVLPLPGLPIPLYTVQKFGLPAAREVARLWRARRPDAVYIATEGPLGASALFVARLLRIPAVTGFHTNFHTYTQDYGVAFLREAAEAYLRELHNRSGATLVPTDDLRQSLGEAGYRNLAVLARGVDTHLYNPARRDHGLRRSWGVDRRGLAVLYVGRLAQEKNLDLAVESFRAMQDIEPRASFVLVGDGPLRRELERTDPGFVFCGWQTGTRLANRYASCDVFLFPR